MVELSSSKFMSFIKSVEYFRNREFFWHFSTKRPVLILSNTGSERILPLIDDVENIYILDDEKKVYVKYLILSFLNNLSFNSRKILFWYYICIIKAVAPKIIITCVDNDELYWEIDKYINKDIVFLTVQNGTHYVKGSEEIPGDYSAWFLKKPPYYSNFACFSKFDYDYYTNRGAVIKNYHCVGNILISKYLNNISPKKHVFDICVIALTRNCNIQSVKMLEYVMTYIKKRGLSACIALKRHYLHKDFDRHINDFYEIVNDSNIVVVPRLEHSTQYLSDSSKVVIGMVGTTVLRQVFSRGNRLYPLNFGIKQVSAPFDLLNHSLSPSYKEFENHLDGLMRISDDDYLKSNASLMKYLDTVDSSHPPSVKLKKTIQNLISL